MATTYSHPLIGHPRTIPLVIGKSSRISPSNSLYTTAWLYNPLQNMVKRWEGRLDVEEGEDRAAPRGADPDRCFPPRCV